MEGDRAGPGRGITPRAVEETFAFIENDGGPRSKYLVRASYLQIYNEARPNCTAARVKGGRGGGARYRVDLRIPFSNPEG